jgi:hypothetical protein
VVIENLTMLVPTGTNGSLPLPRPPDFSSGSFCFRTVFI